jgi:hypothetical protein
VKYLPRKAIDKEWNQLKGEAMWVEKTKVIVTRKPKPVGAHIMTPHALDIRDGVIGFRFVILGFSLALL